MNLSDLQNWFTYHAPKGPDLAAYENIREAGKRFAMVVLEYTPACQDQSVAIRHIRDAVMTANASIACGGGDPSRPGS